MGTIMKSCINCNNNKEQETKPSLRTMSRNFKDKFCNYTITIQEKLLDELPKKSNNSIKPKKNKVCVYMLINLNQIHRKYIN